MKKTSKYRCLAILLLFAFHNARSEEPRVVKVGTDDHFPVLFKGADGAAAGLYVDLLADVGRKRNIRFEYVFGTWDEALRRLRSGQVDLMPGVAYSEARSAYMDYSENPLLTVWGELYALPSSDIDSIFKVSGKKIGVIKGDINADSFMDLTSKFAIECQFVESPGYDDVFKAISEGTVDAGIAGITFGAPKRGEYGLKATGIVFNPYDLFFAVKKGTHKDLLALLDAQLEEWKRQDDSAFARSKQRWMYGSVGAVMPAWLTKVLLLAAALLVLSLAFILLLRTQVRRAVDKIRQREDTLRESEAKFKTMVETVPLAIVMTEGSEQATQYLNPKMVSLFGYSFDDIPSVAEWWLLAYPDEGYRSHVSAQWIAGVRRARETGLAMEPMEVVVTCKDGSTRDVSWCFMPVGDSGYSFGLDLTDRKAAEGKNRILLAEKELLLVEVHHRIKNNMNNIKGLLTLQIATETDPSVVAALREAEGRVQSIIMLYDRLYCTDNYRELSVKDYLEALIREIVGGYHSNGTMRVETIIDEAVLNIQLLTPLGIIVNELLTNIMKHAFIGRDRGLITVSASFKDGRGAIVVRDDGIGIQDAEADGHSNGLGMRLIAMLIEQLNGTMVTEREAGTKVTIEFGL